MSNYYPYCLKKAKIHHSKVVKQWGRVSLENLEIIMTATTPKTTKKTADVSRIRIRINAFDHKIVDQSIQSIVEAAERTGATVVGPVPLPTEKSKVTVNRSTFVHKDAREQYEVRVHKRLVDIMNPNAKTVDNLQSLNLPAGVSIEIKM